MSKELTEIWAIVQFIFWGYIYFESIDIVLNQERIASSYHDVVLSSADRLIDIADEYDNISLNWIESALAEGLIRLEDVAKEEKAAHAAFLEIRIAITIEDWDWARWLLKYFDGAYGGDYFFMDDLDILRARVEGHDD